jgi:hypothetical protein
MSEFNKDVPFETVSPESPCSKCGAVQQDDVLHCDECGEPIMHGYERAGVDEDGEKVTYCDGCQSAHDPRKYADAPLEEL